MNEINADFAIGANLSADVRLSKPNLTDVFAAELGCLRRIVAGMGLAASDGEDVLQDVSIKAMKQTGAFDSHLSGTGRLILTRRYSQDRRVLTGQAYLFASGSLRHNSCVL